MSLRGCIMMLVAIAFFLVGSVLGWGVRVWILIPAALLALIGAWVPVLFGNSGLGTPFLRGTLFLVAVQSGYVFGLISCAILSSKPSNDRVGNIVPFRPRSTL